MEKKVIYPVGEQSFESLRKRDCLYVDKTQFLERLLDRGSKYYFLARPRRFGKSLFLSMMKAFFERERELFKGLYADNMDWDWERHPVLYLDLNIGSYSEPTALSSVLEAKMVDWESAYGITPRSKDFSVRFSDIIKAAYEKTGKGVIILVDEYDKPLVNNLHDEEKFISFRNQLTAVYANFKSSAEYIRLVFLTGVSRFAHLSVFSGLNNITDISFLDEFSDICGITEGELASNFQTGMKEIARKYGNTPKQVHADLKQRYDGYHFSKASEDIYNPYSLLNVMESKEFNNYWIKSGVPTLLEQQIRRFDVDLEELFEAECSRDMLTGLDFDSPEPIALLYQTGYLTIKSYSSGIFTLGLPNEEVKQGFLGYLLPKYATVKRGDTSFYVEKFAKDLRNGDIDSFMKRLQSMFSSVSYQMEMDSEKNLHNAMLMLSILLGMKVRTEYATSAGRIDLFLVTESYYYIIELKIDKSARAALEQINAKDYALPFAVDERRIIKVGVNFSTKTRTIDGWEVEY